MLSTAKEEDSIDCVRYQHVLHLDLLYEALISTWKWPCPDYLRSWHIENLSLAFLGTLVPSGCCELLPDWKTSQQ